LQVKPQVVPSQVAVAFAGGMHGVQTVPHALTLTLAVQAPLHKW
jgi:hypothetical protein